MAQQGELEMWKMIAIAVTCVGCVASSEGAAVQAVTGVTVTARDGGQLAVSWTADPSASRYLVYQSAGGALSSLVGTVFDSSGGAPSTSWIATGLASGVEYCYSIRSGFADGGVGAPGGSGCATAGGGGSASTGVAKTRLISPLSGRPMNSALQWSQSDSMVMFTDGAWTLPLSGFDVGDEIVAIHNTVLDNLSVTITAEIFSEIESPGRSAFGVIGVIGGRRSDGSFSTQVLEQTINHTLVPMESLSVRLTGSGGRFVQFGMMAVDYIPVTMSQ